MSVSGSRSRFISAPSCRHCCCCRCCCLPAYRHQLVGVLSNYRFGQRLTDSGRCYLEPAKRIDHQCRRWRTPLNLHQQHSGTTGMGLVTLEATARGGIRCRPRKRLRSPVIYLLSTFLVGSLYSLFHGSITGGTDGSNNAASMIFRFTSHDCALHDGGFHSRNLLQHAATAATTPAPNKTNGNDFYYFHYFILYNSYPNRL